MKLEARQLIVPLIALVVLALVIQQTLSALRASGSWQVRARTTHAEAEDPYTRVDDLLGQDRTPPVDGLRNPFAYGATRPVAMVAHPHATHTAAMPAPESTPAAPPVPLLTSIVWDADPRATVRYDGRDFPVRVNTLFADFRVKSITANEVILDRNGETIVLALRKGDQ